MPNGKWHRYIDIWPRYGSTWTQPIQHVYFLVLTCYVEATLYISLGTVRDNPWAHPGSIKLDWTWTFHLRVEFSKVQTQTTYEFHAASKFKSSPNQTRPIQFKFHSQSGLAKTHWSVGLWLVGSNVTNLMCVWMLAVNGRRPNFYIVC